MELKVSEIKALAPVEFNFEELKKELTQQLEKYKNLVYTEDNIKEAKSDRALLNKLSTAINDEKKRVKNTLLEPYILFENECKELMAMVDETSSGIDTQIKAFEESQKAEKMKDIIACWIENSGEFQELIDIDLIFNNSWLNKTYTMKKIEADIKHIIEKTKMDLNTIDGQINDTVINKQVKDFYFKNINNASVLSLSLQEGNRIVETNEKLDSLEKKETNLNGDEKIQQLDFRVWGTVEQLKALQQFLKENNIEFGFDLLDIFNITLFSSILTQPSQI